MDWLQLRLAKQHNHHWKCTLAGLSDGPHNLTVFANNSAGNMGASEVVNFTIEVPASSQLASRPLPTVLVAGISGVSAAIVAIGIFYYFKKRTHCPIEGK